jgi:hypothetical protein
MVEALIWNVDFVQSVSAVSELGTLTGDAGATPR